MPSSRRRKAAICASSLMSRCSARMSPPGFLRQLFQAALTGRVAHSPDDVPAAALQFRREPQPQPARRPYTSANRALVIATDISQDAVTRPSRSSTRRTSSNAAWIFPCGKRICPRPLMLLNSAHPSSRRIMPFVKPSRPERAQLHGQHSSTEGLSFRELLVLGGQDQEGDRRLNQASLRVERCS